MYPNVFSYKDIYSTARLNQFSNQYVATFNFIVEYIVIESNIAKIICFILLKIIPIR